MLIIIPNSSVSSVLRRDLRGLVALLGAATVDTASFTRVCRLRFARSALRAAADCPICLDPLGPKYRSIHACGHAFHDGCIREWLLDRGATTCPVCRRDVRQVIAAPRGNRHSPP